MGEIISGIGTSVTHYLNLLSPEGEGGHSPGHTDTRITSGTGHTTPPPLIPCIRSEINERRSPDVDVIDILLIND